MQIKPEKELILENLEIPKGAKPLSLVWIKPGRFVFGRPKADPYDSGGGCFEAIVSTGFWLSSCPVTQAQWSAVMNVNRSQFHHLFKDSQDLPVEMVDWFETCNFSKRLNALFKDLIGQDYRFRLPSEVQWEYACRAGTSTDYYNGDDPAKLDAVAWFKENSDGRTHNVGEKEPNAWGLFDMIGNVCEWCFDSVSTYPTTSATDWVGEGESWARVVRGGSWATPLDDDLLKCTERDFIPPKTRRAWFGFRVGLFIK